MCNKGFLYAFFTVCVLIFSSCKSTKHEDPFLLQIRKTACKGTCPAYIMTITDDKKLVFEGERFTKVEGKHVVTVSDQDYDSLRKLVQQSQFFELDSPKDTRIMDISFTYLEIQEADQQRKLKFANQIPASIQPLLSYLKEIAVKKELIHD